VPSGDAFSAPGLASDSDSGLCLFTTSCLRTPPARRPLPQNLLNGVRAPRSGGRRFAKKAAKTRWRGAAIALHFAHYNFARMPAMAAGIATTVWSMDELLDAALDGVCP
jgi:hypothetical protein